MLIFFSNRKLLFDAHTEDPTYNPSPGERPGGFDWGAGGGEAADAGAAAAGDEQQQGENDERN